MKCTLLQTSLLSFLAIFSTILPAYAMHDDKEEQTEEKHPGSMSIRRLNLSLDPNALVDSLTEVHNTNPVFKGSSTHLERVMVNISLPGERWTVVPIDTKTGKGHVILAPSIDPKPDLASYFSSLPDRFYTPTGKEEVTSQERVIHPNGFFKFTVVTEYSATGTMFKSEGEAHPTWGFHYGSDGYLFYPSHFRAEIEPDKIKAPFADTLTKDALVINLSPLNARYYTITSVTSSDE